MVDWLVRQGSGKPIGPVSTELVIRGIEAGKVALSAEVCRVGTDDWLPLDLVDEFSSVALTDDDEAATRVTDSPWFLEQQSQQRRNLPAPTPQSGPMRPRQDSALGLPRAPAPPPPPPRSVPGRVAPQLVSPARPQPLPQGRPQPVPQPVPQSRPQPLPHGRPQPIPQPAPQPRGAPPAQPRPAANAYSDDDDAKTRVAGAPSEASQAGYEFDDETMTRVARQRVPDQPLGVAPKKPGLLKTAPMWNTDLQRAAAEAARAEAARAAPPTPRPAAGSRPESSIELRADLMPALAMPPAPPGFERSQPGFPQPREAAPGPSPFGPTMPATGQQPPGAYAQAPPAYGPPPAAYAPPQQQYIQQPYQPYPPQPTGSPEPRGDGGVKALIALIVVLFLALMVIVILLVLRR